MLLEYDFKKFNFRLLLYTIALNIIGILVIRSATNQDMARVGKQIAGVIVGLALAAGLSLIPYQKITSFSISIYLGCTALLIAVLFIGRKVNGATRWIYLPVVGQVQPSEFAKIGLIIFSAWYLGKYSERVDELKTLLVAAALFGFPILLVLAEPNLSTSLVIIFTLICMIFIAGISFKWIGGTLAVLIPCSGLFIYLLKIGMIPFLQDYQARRILAWVDRANYADANYQQDNSIMAIGSGMLKGKGLNNNTLASVKNGNFLSEEQTDFIFAVVGEELGFIGCVIVIVLFAAIVFECLWMAEQAKDMTGRLLCTGMAALLAFQTFSNIAVATGIFPNTGLPLPFVSYGVSSLISMYLGIGIVLNVALQRKNKH
ncbi:FtsW/RodA/SpoVE family cell cycle protein [Lachnospiraceae bacterium 62-35]